MLTRRHFAATAGAALFAGPATAQDQTVRLVSGFPAGGGIDISARLLVDPFKEALGQPVIVENRVGAAGMIAANAVAKAPPDGRMMLVSTSGEIAISQHLYKEKMSYDPLKDLAPITLIGTTPNVMIMVNELSLYPPEAYEMGLKVVTCSVRVIPASSSVHSL